jgi:hypothetical protein
VSSGRRLADGGSQAIQLRQANWQGYYAVEQSLRQQPLTPGERRTVAGLLPFYNVVSETVLEAGDPATTSLLNADAELLPVKCTLHIGETIEVQTLWIDKNGEILKSELAGMNQVTYRTDRETALRPSETRLDLALRTSVTVSGLTGNPHEADFARYRVTTTEPCDVAQGFAQSACQTVSQINDSTLEITVTPRIAGPSLSIDPSTKALCLDASPWIQSADRRITELAATIPAGSPAQIATAAESLVREHVENRNFGHAMATAAEVAETRAGDCSEHALLLAAICRAHGIPTRVAIGLVYVPATQSFAYHMWNEAFVGQHWVTLDATLDRVGAGHLKMADVAFENTASLAKLSRMMTSMGKLKIEWLEVR